MPCTTPACFSAFFRSTKIPTLVENSKFFSVLVFKTFFGNITIMIMIEIQYSGTALLLLVNPCVPHQNNGIMPQLYHFNYHLKRGCFVAEPVVWVKCLNCNQSSVYKNYGWFPSQIKAITCLPQNPHFLRWAKMNGTQRMALVSPWRMHCMYSTVVCQKAPLGLKQHQTAKKSNPVKTKPKQAFRLNRNGFKKLL